jgi:hypothetical protein
MDYYRLLDDLDYPERWFLGEVNFDDEWDFWKYVTTGEVEVPGKELFVTVNDEGTPLDFTMADFELLVVNNKVAELMDKAEVQRISLKIAGYTSVNPYYLMTLKNGVDCVDEEKSDFDRFEVDDPIRPDLAGQYKSFYKLVVDPNRCNGHIFRIKNYEGAIIVSVKLKETFEKSGVTGVKYENVT